MSLESGAPLITVRGLSKRYGQVTALTDLTISVQRGEVFGLLGPNGSGKTTTLRTLIGFLRPSSGEASIGGWDCWRQSLQVRRLATYLPGEVHLQGHLTGRDTLRMWSGLREGLGLDRSVAIAERLMELDLRRKVRTYSTGMRQKLALSQVFGDPVDILILDEPTSALDPSARSLVLSLVVEAKRSGQTVIFSGHVLPEVEQVSDRVAILRHGRLMHIEDMRVRRGQRMILVRFQGDGVPEIPENLRLVPRGPQGGGHLFEHNGELKDLLSWLAEQGVSEIAIGTEDLRSLYDRFHGPDVADDEEREDISR